MIPEPTQEQRRSAKAAVQDWGGDHVLGRGALEGRIAQALAAEAAPLRAEIERLKELVEETEQLWAETLCERTDQRRRAEAAEAKVLSLEAEIEKLAARAGELHREKTNAETQLSEARVLQEATALERERTGAELAVAQDALSAALAAASRAREEQGALRAKWDDPAATYSRSIELAMRAAGGPTGSASFSSADVPFAALAPPAAESREDQQQPSPATSGEKRTDWAGAMREIKDDEAARRREGREHAKRMKELPEDKTNE